MASVHDVLQHGDVAWAPAGPEAVVFQPMLRVARVLDPTATLLWQCLDGESTLGEVFADLADAFAVPPERVAADCLPVIDAWLSARMATPAVRMATPAVEVTPADAADGRAADVGRPGHRYLLPPPDT